MLQAAMAASREAAAIVGLPRQSRSAASAGDASASWTWRAASWARRSSSSASWTACWARWRFLAASSSSQPPICSPLRRRRGRSGRSSNPCRRCRAGVGAAPACPGPGARGTAGPPRGPARAGGSIPPPVCVHQAQQKRSARPADRRHRTRQTPVRVHPYPQRVAEQRQAAEGVLAGALVGGGAAAQEAAVPLCITRRDVAARVGAEQVSAGGHPPAASRSRTRRVITQRTARLESRQTTTPKAAAPKVDKLLSASFWDGRYLYCFCQFANGCVWLVSFGTCRDGQSDWSCPSLGLLLFFSRCPPGGWLCGVPSSRVRPE